MTRLTAWRHGEEHLDPFHDEVGYLLWERSTSTVLRCFAVPRGLAILAGGVAQPDSKTLTFMAEPGDPTFGLLQNKYLAQRARTGGRFHSTFAINDDGSFSYTSDLQLTLAAIGQILAVRAPERLASLTLYAPWTQYDAYLSRCMEMRRALIMEDSNAPQEWNVLFGNVENNFAPWKFSPDDRDRWREG